MATMLVYLLTDLDVPRDALRQMCTASHAVRLRLSYLHAPQAPLTTISCVCLWPMACPSPLYRLLEPWCARRLQRVVGVTFNALSIDSDQSTSDTARACSLALARSHARTSYLARVQSSLRCTIDDPQNLRKLCFLRTGGDRQ